jgi:cytochrome oxidase complex assembly protein 1
MASETSAQAEPGNIANVLGSIGIAIVVAAVIFAVYTIRTRDQMASQALNLGKTFIHSSPVVEEDLGPVASMKKRAEKRIAGKGWIVDFDVTGTKARGSVELLMQKKAGEWTFSQADLKTGRGKTSNLL